MEESSSNFSLICSMDKIGFLAVLLLVAVPCSKAFNQTINGKYGCLASPNFPSSYPNNARKSYQIITSPGTTIELKFQVFDIEHHYDCSYDYIQIEESNGASRKLCGSTPPAAYISQSNELKIYFSSDQSVNRPGFFITFQEKSGTPTSTPMPSPTPLPVDGGWCSYNWTSCSSSCGMGMQSGYRACNCPPPSYGGLSCSGDSYTSRACGVPCPSSSPSPMPTPTPSSCNQVLSSLQGNFTSPGYPMPYPNNARCNYEIVVPTGKRIVLTFSDFDLEHSYDYVQIQQTVGGSLQDVTRLTGDSLNTTQFTSAERSFKLIFSSDSSVTKRGFSAHYHTIDSGIIAVNGGWCAWVPSTPCSVSCGYGQQTLSRSCTCPRPSNGGSQCTGPNVSQQPCYQGNCPTQSSIIIAPSPTPTCQLKSYTAPSGIFSSPNFPGLYPNSANCEYQITVATGKAISISFTSFSVESHSSCDYDAVIIYEGSSSTGNTPKAKLCGDGQKTFKSSGNSVFIVFSSDGSVTKKGFEATYATVNKTDGSGGSGGATVNDPSCGITKVAQTRVIGGTDAAKGAWPWQIGMYEQGYFICGGTLIAPNWVLTASHCVVSYGSVGSASDYEIVVGDLHRQLNDTTEQKHKVERIVPHPNYDGRTLNNDIALMKLQTPVMMNDHVRTACIPAKTDVIAIGSTCFITGWGKIKHPGDAHTMLQQAKLPVLNSTVCQKKLDATNWGLSITKQMVCAGEPGSIKSGCHGDSGGPYVCPDSTGRYFLHGDVSWGSSQCDTNEAYTVFARVTEFVDWIKQSLRDL
ncbi:deleted in malignant brain tumors 1 protein-like [Rhopilema esculentum]|uniref:deleted in malignant brain tumors 1 protein-like n=1 Tax=Rhopilema esculentum TaxID=499914 RepID=UPI0031D1ED11